MGRLKLANNGALNDKNTGMRKRLKILSRALLAMALLFVLFILLSVEFNFSITP